MADAVVHVSTNMQLAAEYYQRCGLDVMGPARITTGRIINFSSLEELIDHMISRDELYQIVVSHGSSTHGLLTPFVRGGSHNATGAMMQDLAKLAHDSVFFLLGKAHLPNDNLLVKDAALKMGVRPEVVVRIAEKLVSLRKKKMIVLIRGCNIGANETMLKAYKLAFGCMMISAPKCRMFFLRIRPHLPGRGQTMSGLSSGRATTANTRRRFFQQPKVGNVTSPIIIDVRDIDGHTRVDNESFISATIATNAWAKEFNKEWNGGLPNNFILPVMWDNDESSYHCPNETGYRTKLTFV
jgi:hypothetical protein